MFVTLSREGLAGVGPRVVAMLVLITSEIVSHGAAAMDLPLSNGGAKITLDFADTQQNKLVLVGMIPEIPNVVLDKMSVRVSLGGVQRSYILSPEGEGVATPDLFQMRDTGSGLSFILSTYDNSLTNVYQPLGLINMDLLNRPVSMPASITFNNVTYSAMLTGVYDAQANNTGKGFLGVIRAPAKPFETITHVETLAASPNPAAANQAITIKGNVSLKNFTGAVSGSMHFGDMSPPIIADGSAFQKMLKSGVSHTYSAEGVYVARVTLIGGDEIADTRLFIIVGAGWVVNSQNGAIGRLVKTGGTVSLQVGLDNVPGAINAQTKFMDKNGNTAGVPPAGPPPPAGQTGLAPSNTFSLPGVYVAESQAIDGNGNALGMLRKTIVVGRADVASSNAVHADDVVADSPIVLSSMAGKFFLSSTTSDKLYFTGTIQLPAGYTPKNSAGNDLTIAVGNVIDTVHLNAQGKLKPPSSLGVVTRCKLTTPKLANGVAAGGEKATLSLIMNTSNLDTKGFDTEGITSSVRTDEAGQTSVARFIQVDMLMAGTTYSGLVQVSYSTTTSSSGDAFGNVEGRGSK